MNLKRNASQNQLISTVETDVIYSNSKIGQEQKLKSEVEVRKIKIDIVKSPSIRQLNGISIEQKQHQPGLKSQRELKKTQIEQESDSQSVQVSQIVEKKDNVNAKGEISAQQLQQQNSQNIVRNNERKQVSQLNNVNSLSTVDQSIDPQDIIKISLKNRQNPQSVKNNQPKTAVDYIDDSIPLANINSNMARKKSHGIESLNVGKDSKNYSRVISIYQQQELLQGNKLQGKPDKGLGSQNRSIGEYSQNAQHDYLPDIYNHNIKSMGQAKAYRNGDYQSFNSIINQQNPILNSKLISIKMSHEKKHSIPFDQINVRGVQSQLAEPLQQIRHKSVANLVESSSKRQLGGQVSIKQYLSRNNLKHTEPISKNEAAKGANIDLSAERINKYSGKLNRIYASQVDL